MDFLIDLYYWIVGPRYAPSKLSLTLVGTLLAAALVWAAIGKVKELMKANKDNKPYHAAIWIAALPTLGVLVGLVLLVYTKTIGKACSTFRLYSVAVLSWVLTTLCIAGWASTKAADVSRFWTDGTLYMLVLFMLFSVFSVFNIIVSYLLRAWKRFRNKPSGGVA